MRARNSDKPSTVRAYTSWYEEEFGEDLESGSAEQWYDQVATKGKRELEQSRFWTELQNGLQDWNARFQVEHDDYRLFEETSQPTKILTKSFESVLNKSFRWNVFDNDQWPEPPEQRPSTAPESEQPDLEDKRFWHGPHNWFIDFPDIFRTRLVATYFDGVGYFTDRIRELAQRATSTQPAFKLRASHDGYHAAHLRIYNDVTFVEYDSGDIVTRIVPLEIQVTTTIQTIISKLLHHVYRDWRLSGAPSGWEWDHRSPAFSVNYLGSTLHYLEGMIVMARVQMEDS